jgi:hypothetical protein
MPRYCKFGLIRTFAVLSPVISGGLIAMYIFPWFSKAWTSRRILSTETFLDVFMMLGMFIIFFVELSAVDGACDINVVGCPTFNWLLTWLFFHSASWAAGFYFDCTAWYRALYSGHEIDSEMLMDIRKTTRGSVGSRYK